MMEPAQSATMSTSKGRKKGRNEKQKIDLTAKDVSTNQGKRRESETSFGPAEDIQHKLPHGSSPNPEQKHKPTFKSMKHKAAKVFGLQTSSSTSQPLVEYPSSIEDEENTVTQVEDLSSSPKSIKTPTGASNTVGVMSEPLLTLAQDNQSSRDFGDVVKQKSEAANVRSEPSPSSITYPLCSSSPSSSSDFDTYGTACLEEHRTAGESVFNFDVESTGVERTPTNTKAKDIGALKTLTKKFAEIQKLRDQNKALKENLRATETARKKFQEELELEARIKEEEQKDQLKLQTEVATLRAELERIENEKQSLAYELAKKKEKVESDALKRRSKHKKICFEDKEKSHADEMTKISDELQRVKQELTRATWEHQDAIRGFETQKTAEILELKQQLAEDFQNKMREKEKEIKAQLAISHQKEIEEIREQLQKKTEEELKEGDSDEETHCTENLRAQLQAKFDDQLQDRVTAEVEKILAQEKEIISQEWMKKNDDLRTQIEADCNQQLAKSAQEYQEEMKRAKQLQAEYELKIQVKLKALEEAQEQLASTKKESQHQLEALNQNITALQDQNKELNAELLGREEQSFAAQREYEELREKYQQLEIQAMDKKQLSGGTQSEGDTNELSFPSTCTAAEPISLTQGPPQVEVHSSLIAVANHLSKFVDSETVICCAKERTLDSTAMLNTVKALGLSDQSKPLSYVFVVLPANQHNSSIVLDYTPTLQPEQVVDHPLQDRDNQQIDSDDEYHSNNEETEEDNRTDAQKLQESRRETENLRESNKTLAVELEELRVSNEGLKAAITMAASERPVPATGVAEEDDTSKKIAQMKTMYLQQLAKTFEAQATQKQLRKDLDEMIDKHRSEALKHEATKKELTEKVQEKVRELRLQRSNGSTSLMQPPTSECASSSEDISSDVDPVAQVQELKEALKKSEERIESLQQHVKSFESIEAQNQQLQQNSNLQSTTVFSLKRKLEAVEAKVKLAKNKDEEVLLVRQELAKLQEEKNTFEDEKTCWEREMSADKDSIQDLKKQLADSRVYVSSLEASIKLKPGEVVGEGELEQEIKLFRTEVTLLKIENEDNTRNLKISQKSLAEIERQRLSLERKLNKVAEERDKAQAGINQLQAVYRMTKAQLNDVGKKLDVTLEHSETLAKTVEEQTTRAYGLNEENGALKNKIKELEEALSVVKFQAQQYEEDFAQERRDRESAIGAKDNQFGKLHVKQQQLAVQLAEAMDVAENEKKERLSVNKKLEESAAEIQRLTGQINHNERDFTNTLQAKSEEMEKVKVEKAQIMGRMEHFGTESSKLKQQLERADVVYQQKQNEQLQHIEQLNVQLAARAQALETALADTARLHDDVLAKTTQVKQYKKQTDSFKLKVEDLHEELQRCQDLLEEDQIDLHSCKKRNEMLFNANQHLKANFQHLQEQYQRLSTANQQLEERLANSNELAPYFIHQPLKLKECRGSGSYGSVYSVQLNGIECIAKRVHDILLGQGQEEAVRLEDKCAAYKKFHDECVLLSRMRHPNIVQFMGVQFGSEREYGRELTLVMEHLYINLEDCIKQYQNMEMWLKVSILLDVLKGLAHLHSENIIHRDLTATNILLTTSFHAKIADLGVSKIINVHPLMASKQSKIPGTLGYMPPEALALDPQYHTALDIFSFGVVMLYLVIQEFPQFYENVLTPTCVQRGEVQIQKRRVWIDKLAPNDSIRQIICHCLQDDPHKRPAIAQLSINLLQLTQQYPKPYSDIMDLLRQQPHRAYYQHGQIRTQSSNPALSPRPLPH